MKVCVEALTPMHIGSGRTLSPLEYLWDKDRFTRVNMEAFLADPALCGASEAVDRFASRARALRPEDRYLGADQALAELAQKHPAYALSVDPGAAGGARKDVQEHARTALGVYVPGSTLKGALFAAAAFSLLADKKVPWPSGDPWRQDDDLRDSIAKELAGGDRFFRWLQVSDSDCRPAAESLTLVAGALERTRFARQGKAPLKAATVLYEAVKPGTKFFMDVRSVWDKEGRRRAEAEEGQALEVLLGFAKRFGNKLAQVEGFEPPSSRATLVRLGQGAGAWRTSLLLAAGILQKGDYKLGRFMPKRGGLDLERNPITCNSGPWTVRRAGTEPMGWASLSVVRG